MFGRKEYDLSMIRTSSKDALKRSLMQTYQTDVDMMERMYEFYMKGMENIPDFDPMPPTMMQQVKQSVGDLFGWADANQDKLIGAYNMLQTIRSGKPIEIASNVAATANIPPLPNP